MNRARKKYGPQSGGGARLRPAQIEQAEGMGPEDRPVQPLYAKAVTLPHVTLLYRDSDSIAVAVIYEGEVYPRSHLNPQSLVIHREPGESVTLPGMLHSFKYGQLRKALQAITPGVFPLEKGNTVPRRTVSEITQHLRDQGWDAKFESVRSELRRMGYYREIKTD